MDKKAELFKVIRDNEVRIKEIFAPLEEMLEQEKKQKEAAKTPANDVTQTTAAIGEAACAPEKEDLATTIAKINESVPAEPACTKTVVLPPAAIEENSAESLNEVEAAIATEVEAAEAAVPSKRGRRKKYDWEQAVDLLVRGCPASLVAAHLGCHPKSIFRAIRNSSQLREHLKRENYHAMNEAGSFLAGQRMQLAEKMVKMAMEGNAKVLCHLAKELNLTYGRYSNIGAGKD